MKITFLGGVGTVTGSKYLIEHNDTKVLVDCGLFQGDDSITHHNWDPFPIAPDTIDAIILTHAHIDHTGYIPALVKNGFKGPIYCSHATGEISVILLLDSAVLQEEKAKMHHVDPLYTREDAAYALRFFKAVDYDTVITIQSLQVILKTALDKEQKEFEKQKEENYQSCKELYNENLLIMAKKLTALANERSHENEQ